MRMCLEGILFCIARFSVDLNMSQRSTTLCPSLYRVSIDFDIFSQVDRRAGQFAFLNTKIFLFLVGVY